MGRCSAESTSSETESTTDGGSVTKVVTIETYSTIRANPLETSGRHLTPLARLLAYQESYLMISVDQLFGISFALVSKSLSR
jgi:hypothetical protein